MNHLIDGFVIGEKLSLGAQLRAIRQLRGFSQREAAEALGFSKKAIQRWEAGRNKPHPVHFKMLQQALAAWAVEAAELRN